MLKPLAATVVAAVVSTTSVVAGQAPRQLPHAAWYWNAAPVLADAAARAELFDMLVRERIGTLWVSVPLDGASAAAPIAARSGAGAGVPPRDVRNAVRWRVLIAEAHRRGIRIEALDGDPTWALKVFHAAPLAVVAAIAAYNRQAAANERFDGIHFDIEPYVLLSWRFPRSREQLLRELLELAVRCQQQARESGGMTFGVDIPAWWDARDATTGRLIGDTDFEGVRKSAARHLIDRLDNVGIMNYRNSADGPDGMIAHGTPILEYADQARRARIYMGVETSLSNPSDTWFVAGPPTAVIDERLQSPSSGIGADSRFFGFKLRAWDDGESTHLGLVAPDGMGETPTAAFGDAVTHLGRRFSASADARFTATAETRRDRAMWTMGRDPEWRQLRANTIRDEQERKTYLGFVATNIMLPKITFAGLPAGTLRREMSAAEAAFARHPSFAGMAVHDVDNLRMIVDR